MKKNFFLIVILFLMISLNGQECGEIITDQRDGNQYRTIQICNKCWMKENLRYLPMVYPSVEGSDVKPYYYVYDYNGYDYNYAKTTPNYSKFGVLYNWIAASDGISSDLNPSGVRGICPKGWHLPSKSEWSEVNSLLGGFNISGGKLKEVGTSHWASPNNNATDERDFTALPGGRRDPLTGFQSLQKNGYFWTASDNNNPIYFFMYHLNGILYSDNVNKTYGFSVRCVRDEPVIVHLPNIDLIDITNITFNSANASWSVTQNNSDYITATGIVWSTTPNPTLSNNNIVTGTGYGNFSAQISGLSVGTTYYVRAYATNCEGTIYSNERVFTTIGCCGTSFFDPRDNEQYTTVAIGSQCWMKQNLRYLPSVNNVNQQSNDVPMFYVYGYNGNNVITAKNSPNYLTHGVLYNWSGAMNGVTSNTNIDVNPILFQGNCPIGWHVPNDFEWKEMETILGMPISELNLYDQYRGINQYVGSKLKSISPYWNGSNISNFSALPSGLGSPSGFDLLNTHTSFWTSSTNLGFRPVQRSLQIEENGILRGTQVRYLGLSLRCVRDLVHEDGIPSISIQNINNIGTRSATVNGILNSNNVTILNWGIIYSLTPNPSLNNGTIVYLSGTPTNFTRDLLNLLPNTTYYVRAFVETLCEVVYSNTLNFTTLQIQCPTPFIDPRDNQQYQTLLIGNNCWMKQNLRFLPNVNPPSSNSTTEPRYFVFDYYGSNVNDAILTTNYQNFGVLYNYPALTYPYSGIPYTYPNNLQGPCPIGWHVSSDNDWIELEISQGMPASESYSYSQERAANVGSVLAGNFSMWPEGLLRDNSSFGISNFEVLPSHLLNYPNEFQNYMGAFFWVSNPFDYLTNSIYNLRMFAYTNNGVGRFTVEEPVGFSIRCVKN